MENFLLILIKIVLKCRNFFSEKIMKSTTLHRKFFDFIQMNFSFIYKYLKFCASLISDVKSVTRSFLISDGFFFTYSRLKKNKRKKEKLRFSRATFASRVSVHKNSERKILAVFAENDLKRWKRKLPLIQTHIIRKRFFRFSAFFFAHLTSNCSLIYDALRNKKYTSTCACAHYTFLLLATWQKFPRCKKGSRVVEKLRCKLTRRQKGKGFYIFFTSLMRAYMRWAKNSFAMDDIPV